MNYKSQAEAAKVLGVSVNSMRKWIKEERFPCYRISGRVLVDIDEVRRCMGYTHELHELVDARTLAGLLGVSLSTISRYASTGKIPIARSKPIRLFSIKDVSNAFAQCENP